jgi:hypothetical protein
LINDGELIGAGHMGDSLGAVRTETGRAANSDEGADRGPSVYIIRQVVEDTN